MNLFEETEEYVVRSYEDKEKWKAARIILIGGSDASTLIGMNPYKTNNQLWKEKKGIVKPKELSNDAISHGVALEPVLREWFKQTHQDYEVQHIENTILCSKKITFMAYSPDGLLYHKDKGKGILEIKTTLIQNMNMLDQWNGQIPNHYYIQVLHGLTVTDFDYVILVAEIRFAWDRPTEIRVYEFSREEVKDDLNFLLEEEIKNWNEFYLQDKEPPMILQI